MFNEIIAQENNSRKELQSFIRNLVNAPEDSEHGGRLFFNEEHQYVETINILDESDTLELMELKDRFEEAFENFKNLEMSAYLPIIIAFDAKKDNPVTDKHNTDVHFWDESFSTKCLTLSDITRLCEVLELADSFNNFDEPVSPI